MKWVTRDFPVCQDFDLAVSSRNTFRCLEISPKVHVLHKIWRHTSGRVDTECTHKCIKRTFGKGCFNELTDPTAPSVTVYGEKYEILLLCSIAIETGGELASSRNISQPCQVPRNIGRDRPCVDKSLSLFSPPAETLKTSLVCWLLTSIANLSHISTSSSWGCVFKVLLAKGRTFLFLF